MDKIKKEVHLGIETDVWNELIADVASIFTDHLFVPRTFSTVTLSEGDPIPESISIDRLYFCSYSHNIMLSGYLEYIQELPRLISLSLGTITNIRGLTTRILGDLIFLGKGYKVDVATLPLVPRLFSSDWPATYLKESNEDHLSSRYTLSVRSQDMLNTVLDKCLPQDFAPVEDFSFYVPDRERRVSKIPVATDRRFTNLGLDIKTVAYREEKVFLLTENSVDFDAVCFAPSYPRELSPFISIVRPSTSGKTSQVVTLGSVAEDKLTVNIRSMLTQQCLGLKLIFSLDIH